MAAAAGLMYVGQVSGELSSMEIFEKWYKIIRCIVWFQENLVVWK